MDIDRFWQLIEQARAKAGPAADQALRDYDNPDDDPDRDYWDFDEMDTEADPRAGADDDAADGLDTDDAYIDDIDDLDEDGDREVDDPVTIALVEVLAGLPAAEIAEFDNVFDLVRARADRDDLANAAILIEHGFLGDDSFDDFRAGLVTLGRATYEAALGSPDSLAGHPLVREIAEANDPRWLGREDVIYAASYAYAKVTGEDQLSFYDFAEKLAQEHPPAGTDDEDGEHGGARVGADDWPVTDEAETRRRLPGLSEMFYQRSMRNRSRAMATLGLPD